MSYISNKDFLVEVMSGKVDGYTYLSGIGERESMDTTVTGEDIWRGNELDPAPTSHTSIPIPDSAGEQMTVVSDSTSDTSAGIGIKTVRINYIDATGNEQYEDITMNGTTPVNTVATNIRFVQDMHSLTVGTNGVAVGHLKIYKTGTVGLVYNMIAAGGNQSLVPHRMVPLGKILVNIQWHCEEAQGKRVAIRIRSTDQHGILIPGVFCFKDTAYMKQASSSSLSLYTGIPALSIVKVSGWADQAASEVSCGWCGILVDTTT